MVPQRSPENAPRSPRLRPFNRILVNVALDGSLAAVAAPVARWLAAPQDGLLHPLWFLAGGAITLIVSGVPFRMPQQYWRHSGLSDLPGIACASVVRSALFTAGLRITGCLLHTSSSPRLRSSYLMPFSSGLKTPS